MYLCCPRREWQCGTGHALSKFRHDIWWGYSRQKYHDMFSVLLDAKCERVYGQSLTRTPYNCHFPGKIGVSRLILMKGFWSKKFLQAHSCGSTNSVKALKNDMLLLQRSGNDGGVGCAANSPGNYVQRLDSCLRRRHRKIGSLRKKEARDLAKLLLDLRRDLADDRPVHSNRTKHTNNWLWDIDGERRAWGRGSQTSRKSATSISL